MEPVTLRHKDAPRQSRLYGAFALLVTALIVVAFVLSLPGKWWTLVLLPAVAFLTYSSVRLATLAVRLDSRGLWEPNPFRLTYVTPWSDVARVRKTSKDGAMKTRFLGVQITHSDGAKHEVAALTMQARAAYAEPTVDEWIDAIREAKKAAV